MAPLDTVDHFQGTPWCAKLISDTNFHPVRISARFPKASTENAFMAETLSTDRTIRGMVALAKKPNEDGMVMELRALLDVGNGVNGHPNISHGGFVATLLDQITGMLMIINHEIKTGLTTPTMFTVYLNVRYLRPVPTPSIILATSAYTKIEPRKQFIKGTLEDGMGTVYATAEALFATPKSKI